VEKKRGLLGVTVGSAGQIAYLRILFTDAEFTKDHIEDILYIDVASDAAE
jgi:hypothetical protein